MKKISSTVFVCVHACMRVSVRTHTHTHTWTNGQWTQTNTHGITHHYMPTSNTECQLLESSTALSNYCLIVSFQQFEQNFYILCANI